MKLRKSSWNKADISYVNESYLESVTLFTNLHRNLLKCSCIAYKFYSTETNFSENSTRDKIYKPINFDC